MKPDIQKFRILSALSLAVFTAVLLVGCASNEKEQALMQRQVTRIDERVAAIDKYMQTQADLLANMDQMQGSVLTMTGQIEEFNVRAEMLSKRMAKLERSFSEMSRVYRSEVLERSAETNLRLENLEKQITSLSMDTTVFIRLMEKKSGITESRHRKAVQKLSRKKKSVKTRDKDRPSFKETIIDPDDLYQRSYNSYLRGDYDASINGFVKYVKRFSKTNLSDNAAYWVGESYYGKKELLKASEAFDAMAKSYPTSNKAPTALLKSAHCLLEVNSKDAAIERLKKIIDDYSISGEAITASELLSAQGVSYP